MSERCEDCDRPQGEEEDLDGNTKDGFCYSHVLFDGDYDEVCARISNHKEGRKTAMREVVARLRARAKQYREEKQAPDGAVEACAYALEVEANAIEASASGNKSDHECFCGRGFDTAMEMKLHRMRDGCSPARPATGSRTE